MSDKADDMSILEVSFKHRYASGFTLDVDFAIDSKITSIFGSSGSGKTTILAMIAGLRVPAQGTIVLNDRVLFDHSSRINVPIHQRRIGVIFQDHLLFPHLNVENNLLYGFHGGRTASMRSDVERVCDVLEIGHLLGRYPKTLSGGECQRVAIGRTLLSGPEALLMDEPLASLDDRLRDSILKYLDRIIEEWNIPAIFISHNQSLVQRFSSHTIVLDQGRVLSAGLTSSTIEAYGPDIWKSAKGPMNWLKIDSFEKHDGFMFAIVFGQKIQLPGFHDHVGDKMYIQFSANDVVLAKDPLMNISTRNHLHGDVVRFVEQASHVLVGVDIGSIVWAKITLEAKRELNLEIGVPIVLLIKIQALDCVG